MYEQNRVGQKCVVFGHARYGVLLERLERRSLLSTVVVNTSLDDAWRRPFEHLVTLRDALRIANRSDESTTITFDPAVFAHPQTIILGNGGSAVPLELANRRFAVAITAPAAGVTLSGNGRCTGIVVDVGVTATIANVNVESCFHSGVINSGRLTLSNCSVAYNVAQFPGGGGIYNQHDASLTLTNVSIANNSAIGSGGGICNYGNATLDQCKISDNIGDETTFGLGGGGIFNAGRLSMVDCTASGNSASSSMDHYGGHDGGGLFNYLDGQATLTRVKIDTNTGTSGGGIFNYGKLALTDCFLTANQALHEGDGGGIENQGTAILTNVTVGNNLATWAGGGIDDDGDATLVNVTIADNTAMGVDDQLQTIGWGGGLSYGFGSVTMINATVYGNQAVTSGGGIAALDAHNLWLANTIVAGNSLIPGYGDDVAGPDVFSAIHSMGHNLIGQTDASTGWIAADLTGTAARPLNSGLSPLADNGGFSPTILLLSTSPARDHGDNLLLPIGLSTDGRDLPRVSNGTVDIGAVELQT